MNIRPTAPEIAEIRNAPECRRNAGRARTIRILLLTLGTKQLVE